MDARDSFRSFISRGRSLSLAPMLVLCAAMAGCSDRTVETVPGGVVPDGGIDAGGSPFEFADKHIHFDLSPHIAHGDTFIAHVARQHRPVKPHTNETRAALRRAQPALAAVPDESLTHYIDGVTLPSDRAALVWVTQHHPVDGPGLALTGIYIPPASMQKARMAKARQGWPRYAHLLAAPPPADGGTDATADIMHAKPIEIAKAVLFHHPELMRLDADTAAQTMVHIESAGGLHDLSLAISQQGQAHVHTAGKQDGWAVLKPINLPDGTQKIDSNGKPMFKYTISDKTVAAAGAALKYALRSSKDDPDLRNVTYSVQDGNGPINATPVATLRLAEAASPYRLDLSEAHDKSGLDVKVENLSTATDRKIKATFTNHWLRHLGLYVQFLDADKNPLDIANPGDSYIDDPTYRAKYLGQLFPVLTIMGIPLSAEDQEFEVDIPDEATYVRFLAGGFGTSQYKWSKTMKWGGLTTGIFEYGLPCLFLAAATGLNETASLKAIMHDGELLFAAVAIGGFLFAPFEGGAIASEGTTREVLGSFADFIADMLWHAGMEKLGEWVTEKLTEEEMEQAVPFAGWAIKALTIAPTVAALVETTAEVLSSPVAIDNTVATLMKTTVTLHPDPTHGAFPQTATHYKVTASFSHNTSQKVEDTVPATSALKLCANDVPCIDVTFPNVPVGGQVMFTVGFYSKTGWLAGKAETAWMDNLIPAGKDEFALDVTIKEMLVPLTIDTTYSHKQKLAYVNGKYAWEATGAPAATFADRSCDNVGGNLCQPYKITYSDPDGTTQFIPFIGYAWQSAGPSQADCVSGQANTQSYFIQSISDNPDPDEHVLTVPCGFTSPMHIVYDVVHPDRKYFIDPRNGQFNLRKLDVGAADWSLGSFAGKSWGRFTQPFDAVALHPDGRHMVGANWANSKLEVLEIPDSSSPDASAPIATPISGMGIREGLIHGPRAMAFAPDGTLLVLEDINARIQAFDLGGNPAPLFTATAAKYWAPLKAQTAPVTYLDLGVENTGFMYVLYYLHDGSLTSDYHVDIYRADGMHLAATQGVAAARLTVDLWRNMFTLNWEKILGRNNRVEPSVSEWIPSTPSQP